MMKNRAVIFDCFGVLYADPGQLFYERNIKNYDQLKAQLLNIDKQIDYGFIDEREHAEAVAELSGLDAEMILANIRKEHSRNDELIDYMKQLRPTAKIGLLSNIGSGGMESFFSSDEQGVLFDDVVLSSDVGMIKPNPEIFELAATRLGVELSDCIFIDDRAKNCEAARSVGMTAVLYQGVTSTIEDIKKFLT